MGVGEIWGLTGLIICPINTAMSEVLFYHLERQPLPQVLPLLLQKTLERGWTAVVQTDTDDNVAALSKILWTWREDSFLPHGSAVDGKAEQQPIWICCNDDTPNKAEIRFLVDGAMAAEPERFTRLVHMFDGHDGAAVTLARQHWKQLTDDGHDMTYWQQDDSGKWQKMA